MAPKATAANDISMPVVWSEYPTIQSNVDLSRFIIFILELSAGHGYIETQCNNAILVLFSDNDLKDLLSNKFKKSTNNYSPEKFLKDNYSKYNDLERIERIYLETYLPSLFIVEDKLGMAHSIEARIPFCSNDLIDFSLKTDIQNKLNNLELKYLIKNYLKKSLPKKFFNQKKMGFPTPLAKWFKGPLKKYIYDTLLSEKASNRDIFNKNKIIEILDKHCKGKKDYSFQIWSILSIELWFQTFID